MALGTFGAGNVGAAGTKLLVGLFPAVLTAIPATGLLGGLVPGGWRFIPAFYSVLLLVMVVVIRTLAPVPDPRPGQGRRLGEFLAPMQHLRVWRFSLYYVVVFGAYVALSGWLPTFYKEAFHVPLRTAALLTATFIIPASLLRPLGGWLSDRYGPRVVTYAVFIVMSVTLVALSVPYRTYWGVPYRLGPGTFAALMFVVGCAMGVGKASVFKYVPDYFPDDVGAVGGLVGMLGAGRLLPAARLRGARAYERSAPDGVLRLAWPDALEPDLAARDGASAQPRGGGPCPADLGFPRGDLLIATNESPHGARFPPASVWAPPARRRRASADGRGGRSWRRSAQAGAHRGPGPAAQRNT